MSATKVQTPTAPGRSRLGVFSPAQRVLRADLESKVRVVVRVRPFLPMEIEAAKGKPISCITITKASGNLEREDTLHIQDSKTSRNESYKLDYCYGQEDDVGQIFSREVDPILPGLFRGSNATVFAYGATGSGKTYTMQGTDERPGLMPLAMTSILSMAENTDSTVEISYYEVYMDRCYDLLEPKTREVSVLEDSEGRVQLRGLAQSSGSASVAKTLRPCHPSKVLKSCQPKFCNTCFSREITVNSLDEFQEVFTYGCMRRKVGHTGLNDVSSRSHGVLMISVSSDDGNPDMPLVGKLNLIDLAGNEDNRRTGNEGIRLTESVRINQSLFALSNVIHALNANESRVPYRDSKLTRILQDSLGGTSRALMIACLNPRSYQEALHTVSLAARSRQIVNHVASDGKQDTPRPKVDMGAKLNAWLEAKGRNNGKAATPGSSSVGKISSPLSRQTPSRLLSGTKASATEGNFLTPKGRRLFGPPGRVKLAASEESPKPNSSKVGELPDAEMAAPNSQVDEPQKSDTSVGSIKMEDISKADSQTGAVSEFKHMTFPHDESFDKENRVVAEKMFDGSSPPLSARLKELRNALTEMLTPKPSIADRTLPVNVTPSGKSCGIPLEAASPETPPKVSDKSCAMPLEAASPKTPKAQSREVIEETPKGETSLEKLVKEESPNGGTPLEKFSARSTGLKKSLAREYLSFLNTASRFELVATLSGNLPVLESFQVPSELYILFYLYA
eukprot:Gb_27745 [translate_table: standard]